MRNIQYLFTRFDGSWLPISESNMRQILRPNSDFIEVAARSDLTYTKGEINLAYSFTTAGLEAQVTYPNSHEDEVSRVAAQIKENIVSLLAEEPQIRAVATREYLLKTNNSKIRWDKINLDKYANSDFLGLRRIDGYGDVRYGADLFELSLTLEPPGIHIVFENSSLSSGKEISLLKIICQQLEIEPDQSFDTRAI